MPTHITSPTIIQAAGNKPKLIEEFIGRVNNQEARLSLARMRSPGGWVEPGQTPEFDEFTVVLAGRLRVETAEGAFDVLPGQAVHAEAGEWVRYSTPGPEGAEYIAICLPAFAPVLARKLHFEKALGGIGPGEAILLIAAACTLLSGVLIAVALTRFTRERLVLA